MLRLSYSCPFDHLNDIGWAVQIIKLLIMQFSLLLCYLGPLTRKYSPRHLILKHPQPTFLPQYQRPSSTPIQNNRQHCSSQSALICEFMLRRTIRCENFFHQNWRFAVGNEALVYSGRLAGVVEPPPLRWRELTDLRQTFTVTVAARREHCCMESNWLIVRWKVFC